jgi:hypothetical protein
VTAAGITLFSRPVSARPNGALEQTMYVIEGVAQTILDD